MFISPSILMHSCTVCHMQPYSAHSTCAHMILLRLPSCHPVCMCVYKPAHTESPAQSRNPLATQLHCPQHLRSYIHPVHMHIHIPTSSTCTYPCPVHVHICLPTPSYAHAHAQYMCTFTYPHPVHAHTHTQYMSPIPSTHVSCVHAHTHTQVHVTHIQHTCFMCTYAHTTHTHDTCPHP